MKAVTVIPTPTTATTTIIRQQPPKRINSSSTSSTRRRSMVQPKMVSSLSFFVKKMGISLLFFVSLFFVLIGSVKGTSTVTRKGNLDYYDAATLDYYINYNNENADNAPIDFDIVVMYYAKWCKNCHALAPTYDQISKILKGGTTESNLIFVLFDCEYNVEHSNLCTKVGVQHYPTISYINLGATQKQSYHDDSDMNMMQRLSSLFSKATTNKQRYHHIIQFGGNWQYGESILDWIKTMRFISRYQRSGIGTKLRNLLIPKLFRKKNDMAAIATNKKKNSLPIGIPKGNVVSSSFSSEQGPSTTSATGSTTSKATTFATSSNGKDLELLQKKYEKSLTLSRRASVIIESLLFPLQIPDLYDEDNVSYPMSINISSSHRTDNNNNTMTYKNKSYTDMFTYMYLTDSWNATNPTTTVSNDQDMIVDDAYVFKTCISELSYDYCNRISDRFMYEWVTMNANVTDITDTIYQQYDVDRKQHLQQTEPYCTIIESCIQDDFLANDCRPMQCPFYDEIACRYITSCLSEEFLDEYTDAIYYGSGSSSNNKKATSSTSSTHSPPGGGGGDKTEQDKMRKTSTTTTPYNTTMMKEETRKNVNDDDDATKAIPYGKDTTKSDGRSKWGLKQ